MNILILVLSFTDEPYLSLMRQQQTTWDSIEVEGVATIYYHGVKSPAVFNDKYSDIIKAGAFAIVPYHPWSMGLVCNCTDEYYYMAEKFKLALEFVHSEYDYIFRTNSSSYVNKQKLKEFAETLPTEKLYAGWEIKTNEGFGMVSGAGIFMSPDVVDILRREIDPAFEKEEDYYIASILNKHQIPIIDDKSRFDVPAQIDGIPEDRYHYRLKCGADRMVDVYNMKIIHNLLK